MKTRDLTPNEQARVDAAWEEYLDIVGVAESVETVNYAWSKYSDTLKDANIIPTLAGYRKALK